MRSDDRGLLDGFRRAGVLEERAQSIGLLCCVRNWPFTARLSHHTEARPVRADAPNAVVADARREGRRAETLVKPGTKYQALLCGGCHGSRCCNRSMGAEKGAD